MNVSLLCQLVVGSVASQEDGENLQPPAVSSHKTHHDLYTGLRDLHTGLQERMRMLLTMRNEKVVMRLLPQGLKSTVRAAE